MDATEIAEIVATVLAARSEPAAPVAAETVAYVSPLERLGLSVGSKGSAPDLPPQLLAAWNAAPDGKRQREVRETARILRTPRFSCTVDVKAQTATGETITMAQHGYAYPSKSGDACNSKECPGKVR
jgi:hypothetical protein